MERGCPGPICFFNDKEYTDVQYMKEYPTIHHLICELMDNKTPHDVRLVYLACAWLITHRGHFLNNLNVENWMKSWISALCIKTL